MPNIKDSGFRQLLVVVFLVVVVVVVLVVVVVVVVVQVLVLAVVLVVLVSEFVPRVVVVWQACGDTESRPKGGWVDYRKGKQFKTGLWGKTQGELFEKSQGKHGIGPYSGHAMFFVSLERQVCRDNAAKCAARMACSPCQCVVVRNGKPSLVHAV